MLLAASAAVLVLALAFAVISSGHDVSNAIAMPVRHRALTARTALVMAAVFNVLGVALATTSSPVRGSGSSVSRFSVACPPPWAPP